jgi:branched-chain amino acid transport system permease protein
VSAVAATEMTTAPPVAGRVRRATTSSYAGAVIAVALVTWLAWHATRDVAATQTKIVEVCVFVAVASMWNLLAGYAGLVSIGQQAFTGLGTYALVVFVNGHGWNLYLSVLPAAVVALIASVPIGFVAFRLRGAYFAVGTWVIAEVVALLLTQYTRDPIKGGSGTSIDAPARTYPKDERYQLAALLAIAVAVLAVAIVYAILRSRLGLALQAVRDNEAAARGLGIASYRTRFTVFLAAAFVTGAAGAIWYMFKLRVDPKVAFGVADWTAPIVVMVVIGGLGTIEGPIIGAVAFYLLQDYLTNDESTFHLDPLWYQVATGVVAVVFALWVQRGIWGTLQHRYRSLQLFPVRRTVHVTTREEDTHHE